MADTKAFDRLDFSLSYEDVLLYVGGKNEDAIAAAVLLTEDRIKAF